MNVELKRTISNIAHNKGTPFYIFSETDILKTYNNIRSVFEGKLDLRIFYSVKTNYELEILKVFKKLGCGAEVSSMLDLYSAEKAGFTPDQIIADGFLKENTFLKTIVNKKVNTINAESISELININKISAAKHIKTNVGIRFRLPPVFNMRNLLINSFQKLFYDFGIQKQEINKNILLIKTLKNININTIMAHNASPFVNINDFLQMLKVLFLQAYKLRKQEIKIDKINMGGNLPLASGNTIKQLEKFARRVNFLYKKLSSRYGFAPALIFEPGRLLIDEAGFLVGRILKVRGKWVIIDIFRSDYGFTFPFRRRKITLYSLDNKAMMHVKNKKYDIKANNLSQFDTYKNIAMPSALCQKGNLLLMSNIGAYSLPFSYQFIRPRLPIYMLRENGELSILREKETCKDVLKF